MVVLFFLLLLFAGFIPASMSTSNCSAISQVEYNSLYDMYNQMNGIYWYWQQNYTEFGIPWNFSDTNANPCVDRWQGLTCNCSFASKQQLYIESIQLGNYGLDNSIPNSIANLSSLSVLNMSHNFLYGQVTSGLAQLNNLTKLDLGFNYLSLLGEIGIWPKMTTLALEHNFLDEEMPAKIYNLTSLEYFIIPYAGFTGTLSTDIGNLHNLVIVDMAENRFKGRIPPSISTLSKLKYLNLEYNDFTGSFNSDQFATRVSSLEVINLDFNKVYGRLSPLLFTLPSIRVISLAFNVFYGTLPQNFSSSLLEINLEGCKMQGSISSGWFNARDLTLLYLNQNLIQGTIPNELGLWSELRYFSSPSTILVGTLPNSLCDMSNLIELDLQDNFHRGSIPDCVGRISSLRAFVVNSNYLTGSIPDSFGNISTLQTLYLSENRLITTIPSSFVNLQLLSQLLLGSNLLYGDDLWTIVLQIHSLTSIDFSSAGLIGSLPANISLLTNLVSLELTDNKMTGTIPPGLYDLSLYSLYLGSNSFEGSLFSSNASSASILASSLSIIDVSNNMLSGTLPPAFTSSIYLITVILDQNSFHGDINFCIGENTGTPELETLILSYNQFNGTIPSSLQNCPGLYYLEMEGNYMTGTIPEFVWQNKDLSTVSLSNNYLHGSLSSNISNAKSLSLLGVADNYMTGTIPFELSTLKQLAYVNLSSNFFTGKVENIFSRSKLLKFVILSNNFFSGPLDTLLDYSGTRQKLIEQIVLHNNQFTSTIPPGMFAFPALESFTAALNCLEPNLPNTICQPNFIITIVLDGMHANQHCKDQATVSWSNSIYLTNQQVGSTVPSCIYGIRFLYTLQLSGNNFVGSLPNDAAISRNLTKLSLSHNNLHGTIPSHFLDRTWGTLDLSFNGFTGTLSKNMQPLGRNQTLNLSLNFLSGEIPANLLDAKNIAILSGNMFECNSDYSKLPQNDPQARSYQCGSDYTNLSLEIFAGFLIAFFVIVLILSRQREAVNDKLQPFWKIFSFDAETAGRVYMMELDGISTLGAAMRSMRRLLFLIAGLLLFTLMPTYAVLTSFFGTFTYMYVWTVSFSFLGGVLPAIALLLLLLVFLSIVLVELGVRKERSNDRQIKICTYDIGWVGFAMFALIIVVNCAIVLGANAAYVLAITSGINSNQLLGISFLLSIFKLLWGSVDVVELIGKLLLGKFLRRLMPTVWNAQSFATWQIGTLYGLALFNNIAAPYIAEAFAS